MAKFVPDVKTQRWVVVADSRRARPHVPVASSTTKQTNSCPLCPENDALNKELYRSGDDQFWKVRVISNKYPITDLHEVIIHSPDHAHDLDELPIEQVELLFRVYRERYNYHVKNSHGQVLIFQNHDVQAGASISHPHSQLVVLPKQINLDTVPREPVRNVILETDYFVAYCPDFSQWPYEVWIAPREMQNQTFGDIRDDAVADLAVLLQKILKAMVKKFEVKGEMRIKGQEGELPYNYYIFHGADWYLRIIPRLIHRAGFELGTGLSVNIVDPTDAAIEFRKEIGVN